MSKLWKGVKKVFKKVTKFVKKYWKVIVIAAAVYFTAGMALAAMPSTAAFSAAMPGFGVGGMFSNAAVAMGATGAAGSGIAGTVAAQAAAAAGAATAAGATGLSAAAGGSGLGLGASGGAGAAGLGAAGGMPGAAGSLYTGAQAAGMTAVGGQAAGTAAAAAAAAAKTATAGKGIIAGIKGMSALEKVALAGTVFKTAGGLLSDSADDDARRAHNRRYAQSFGKGRTGEGPGWGGAASDAFAGKFGSAEGVGAQPEEGEGAATPFTPVESPTGAGAVPFSDMAYSEQAAQRDQAAVNTGYRNKSYMPT